MNLNQRASGVLLHITSLPGPHGIGDLGPSAFHFVDWLEAAGQRVWQLLPTTPIGPGDSPYQSVSAFAGSPLMVALEPLVEAGWLAAPEVPAFGANAVDFAAVVPWRMQQLRAAAAGFFARATAAQRQAYAAWAQAQASWLDDYSLFMALESAHGGACWWDWAPDLRSRKKAALTKARKEHADEIAFWCFVQWQFDNQLAAVKAYANGKGIALMGDLPIFIAHHSADCWAAPEFYFLDDRYQPTVVAGVPPDALSADGQRWGNPLYRWDAMAKTGYAWWTERVRRALAQADVFRIDHFRGFAGYYEIPASCPTAHEGRWVPGPGQALFDAIAKALGPLPIVAEDLGLITPDVIALREGCGFPGMKILQFGFGAEGDHEFLPHNYERETIVYTGTHDNDTARGWWNAAPAREREYAACYLACGAHDVHWAMIRAAANSVANLAIFPLQDVLGLDSSHRMNTPGTLGGGNWAWRFTWDQVGSEPGRVLGLITAASGRGPFDRMKLPA
ncbi:4-alpha-glucanotransferase [Inhella gelatinilytica]|uniref:4-alpha-glucanotransferase n=1 Tax=Inhella gelatinilytica TaxID=2795030 RepID=A0A931NDT2_9BURK|nr:4-alpha-glucanotransferase [Inhella gelatinilytica]MBH9551766.1 4-alpha-glucanotransferase [Inhella gelatinilytica]